MPTRAQILRRMVEHCERQKACDVAFWDRMILHYQQALRPEGVQDPPPGPRQRLPEMH